MENNGPSMQMHGHSFQHTAFIEDDIRKKGIERVAKCGVSNHSPVEKGGGAQALGAIDDLGRQHEISWRNFLPQ